ncbi:MAG: adenylosuccinate lyase [Clostridia bacterium]|nr:adenylosuccinate lyase [Clostridia bacterium]
MARDTGNKTSKVTTNGTASCGSGTSAVGGATLDKKYKAICALDGRYDRIEDMLWPYFSEYALVEARVFVETAWLVFLMDNISIPAFDKYDEDARLDINEIASLFDEAAFLRVKEIESTTNHDVKACELYVAEKLEEMGYGDLKSFVHFGLTSEDVTNLAYARILGSFRESLYLPTLDGLIKDIGRKAIEYAGIPMLAHTHGQAATPTTVGKELSVYVHRLSLLYSSLEDAVIYGKINGATGNYSAMAFTFPEYDWEKLAEEFVELIIGAWFNPTTTQIESHDYVATILDLVAHINNVIRDLDLDMWSYISRNYFKLKKKDSEVGSSTMPHKVNPIDFENSEGNIKVDNPLCRGISDELVRSREQRDLSDSTVQRNLGLCFGYSVQAILSTKKGLSKSVVNEEAVAADLENNWAVLAEPIQQLLRKYGVPDAYNQLKALTRGRAITKEDIHAFIETLDMISADDKERLLALTPSTYIGYAEQIAINTVHRYLGEDFE